MLSCIQHIAFCERLKQSIIWVCLTKNLSQFASNGATTIQDMQKNVKGYSGLPVSVGWLITQVGSFKPKSHNAKKPV